MREHTGLEYNRREHHTVPVEHGVTRELVMIGSVVAMGVLAALAILLPAAIA